MQSTHTVADTSSASHRTGVDTSEDWWYWPRNAEGKPIPPEDWEAENSTSLSRDPNSRTRWVAHRILKQGADLLDPIALKEPPNRQLAVAMAWLFDETPPDHDPFAIHRRNHEIKVSEPTEHVPEYLDEDGCANVEYGIFPHRWRVCEEYGHLVRGPVIADRSTEEFLEIVEFILDIAGPFCDRYISERERSAILNLAESMKVEGDAHDVTIMAEIVSCLEDPGRIG